MQLLKVFLPPSLNAKTCQDFATYKGGQKGNSTMILVWACWMLQFLFFL